MNNILNEEELLASLKEEPMFKIGNARGEFREMTRQQIVRESTEGLKKMALQVEKFNADLARKSEM